MRILIVSQHYPPRVNGNAIQCAEVARGLSKRGHEVLILTSDDNKKIPNTDENILRLLTCTFTEGYKSLSLRYLSRQMVRRGILRTNCRVALNVAKAFRPAMAYIWQFDAIGIGLAQRLQRLGIPIVFNVGDSILCDLMLLLKNDPNPLWRIMRHFLYGINVKEFDIPYLVFVSEQLKKYYVQRGFTEGVMTVIPNGIDPKFLAESPPQLGSGNKILFAGRIDPTKGAELALEALALLRSRESHFKLDFIGEGRPQYINKLSEYARTLGLVNQIRFLGSMPRDTLMQIYQNYDMVLFPSVWFEAFGLTIIEAMSRGVPVVASNRGGPKDIIDHMEDGILVEPEDPKAIVEGITILHGRPDLRLQMGEKAIKKVREKFTLDRSVALIEGFLTYVAGNDNPKVSRPS